MPPFLTCFDLPLQLVTLRASSFPVWCLSSLLMAGINRLPGEQEVVGSACLTRRWPSIDVHRHGRTIGQVYSSTRAQSISLNTEAGHVPRELRECSSNHSTSLQPSSAMPPTKAANVFVVVAAIVDIPSPGIYTSTTNTTTQSPDSPRSRRALQIPLSPGMPESNTNTCDQSRHGRCTYLLYNAYSSGRCGYLALNALNVLVLWPATMDRVFSYEARAGSIVRVLYRLVLYSKGDMHAHKPGVSKHVCVTYDWVLLVLGRNAACVNRRLYGSGSRIWMVHLVAGTKEMCSKRRASLAQRTIVRTKYVTLRYVPRYRDTWYVVIQDCDNYSQRQASRESSRIITAPSVSISALQPRTVHLF